MNAWDLVPKAQMQNDFIHMRYTEQPNLETESRMLSERGWGAGEGLGTTEWVKS